MAASLAEVRKGKVGWNEVQLGFNERLLAGALSRCLAQTALHPVDVVRTRLQAKMRKGAASAMSMSVFLKGVIPQFVLALPAGAMQFVALEYAREQFQRIDPENKRPNLNVLLSSLVGSTVSMLVRVPQEVIKQGVQADLYAHSGVAVRSIMSVTGVAGFYKGFFATLSRDVPWNTFSFLIHHRAKTAFRRFRSRLPTDRENMLLATMSGALAASITTPIDVVKTRIMTQRAGEVSRGIVDTLSHIIREEGVGILYKGLLPRMLYLGPLAGIFISVYERASIELRKRKAAKINDTASMLGMRAMPSSALSSVLLSPGRLEVRLNDAQFDNKRACLARGRSQAALA
uniref:Mitochondrial carrier protein n=1 Tax=Erythrolobus australicus TaxID=1077150 RepID=A0A7S1TJF8_9RHOD|mmetsp:Transcript_1339/g.3671  ORF Transcript_1339/g.3671 Transcript_1339/m.3671 type:complete len:345 (+) Transcript_1339:634-1668(+)